ncbi:CRISPR-associated endonuclease Cas3'' [Rhodocyclus tenuis]|uniref:CRISPR-associated endonuclease Cas3 n=1 Tax=Rhodocyclus gracilis TaxID=2929842 RepID=A0ABX0WGZ2_9RHOO|nr:CRISPR-associated endonuclease Cas3'' [Rhodocyclus gracilis]NJA88087.1 CRISPR-associated endonuclease Cas3'' [Rhodocyclus gracilis]
MTVHTDFTNTDFLAHIRNDTLTAHLLEEHLRGVSALAAEFAAEFGAAPWAALAGIWHDLGKYRDGFQRYILQCGDPDAHIEGRVAGPEKTHSAAGALWAQQYLAEVDKRSGPVVARVLAYLIAGHHAGLDNWFGGLNERFHREDTVREGRDALAAAIPDSILKPPGGLPELKAIRSDHELNIPGRFALWVRMLFSCLVDADFLDTETFMSPGVAATRKGFAAMADLENLLAGRLAQMAEEVAVRGEADTPVNRKRAEVLRACLAKAECPPGVFSLTVPTGGGKTLSSLAFALRHAVRHGKRRVIYAIPYTSIIEQTAGIFRSIFGDENVIEHHSNVEVDEKQETARSRLACENWDAPLIVTTNVQLLESLFASRTSRCRKLHNLVGSVIVLDEAQLLPVPYLQPVVDVLRLLVKDYGVTLVLCTATQPTLESRNGFDQARQLRGFAAGEIREIVDDVAGLYGALERVKVHLPADLNTRTSWEQLAPQIASHDAVLAVVGRRADARELYMRVKAEDHTGLWHLSGLMCAEHRSHTIADIKQALATRRQALAAGQTPSPIRVISTQLVEAGVDIDFPVVYRALAGLDSIAQAAGRCNREGRLDKGEVHVFVPPKPAPPGLLRMAEQATQILWEALPPEADPMGVERFAEFFRRLYGDSILDAKEICNLLRAGQVGDVNFRIAAERFRLIDEAEGATVFVRYKRNADDNAIDVLLNTLKKEGPQRWLLRKLQRYGVSVYQQDLKRLERQGDIEPLGGDFPGLYVQSSGNDVLYDRVLGLNVDGAPGDPGNFVQ